MSYPHPLARIALLTGATTLIAAATYAFLTVPVWGDPLFPLSLALSAGVGTVAGALSAVSAWLLRRQRLLSISSAGCMGAITTLGLGLIVFPTLIWTAPISGFGTSLLVWLIIAERSGQGAPTTTPG